MEIKVSSRVPQSENSQRFHQGMVDRMCVSFHKYGPVAEAYPEKISAVSSLVVRLAKYVGVDELRRMVDLVPPQKGDGNTEWMMDAANFAMIEFEHPAHPKAHYKPTDSNESPGRVWQPDEFDGTVEISQRANDLSC